jgi:glycerate dehydrogenase
MNADIVVLDGHTINPGDNPWTPIEGLGAVKIYDRTPPELTRTRAASAQVLLTSKVKIDAGMLQALPNLRYVGVMATGHDAIDVRAAGELGIPVSNVPGYCAPSVAQTAFGLLIELCTGVGEHDAAVKAGAWVASPDHTFTRRPVVELSGLTLGVVGWGRNGQAVARVAAAFGMKVIAYTPRLPIYSGDVSVGFVTLEQLFTRADAVVLCCPQTEENRRFVNRELLGKMKRSAYLVNVARGGLVDEQHLVDALREGRIAGAGLDVIAREPMTADSPLLSAPRCVLTPHLGWASVAARKRLMEMLASNLRAFLEGSPQNVVNAEWLRSRAAAASAPARPAMAARRRNRFLAWVTGGHRWEEREDPSLTQAELQLLK